MKKTFLLGIATMISVSALAETPLWVRDVAISPDGRTIAFTYKGDIFSVPTAGGGRGSSLQMMRLTQNLSGHQMVSGSHSGVTGRDLTIYSS